METETVELRGRLQARVGLRESDMQSQCQQSNPEALETLEDRQVSSAKLSGPSAEHTEDL